MANDRTHVEPGEGVPTRPAVRGPIRPAGLFPNRNLITRRPGDAGWQSVVLGSALMVIAILVFLRAFDAEPVAFEFDAPTMAERWNDEAAAQGLSHLMIDGPAPRPEGPDELVFGHAWSDTFLLRGRIDVETGRVVELSVVGSRTADGGEAIVAAMDLVVAVTEPELTDDERTVTLQELGVIGGDPTADLAATRGDTDYVAAAGPSGDNVGMSAAPHSTLTSGLR